MTGSDDAEDAMRRALMLDDGRPDADRRGHRPALDAARWLGEARRDAEEDLPERAVLTALAAHLQGDAQVQKDAKTVLADAWGKNRLAAAFEAHSAEALDVAWSPEGMLLASAGADGEGVVWDFAGRAEVARLKGHEGRIRSIAFNPVEPLILTACDDGTVRVWNAADGRETARVSGFQTAALAARFSPRGHVFVVAADADRAAVLSNSGAEISRLEGHEGLVLYDAAFSPDGKRVLTAGDDGAACLFDTASGERLAKLVLDGAARSVCFSGDGAHFAVAGYDGRVRVARTSDARVEHDLPSPGGRAYFVAFAPGDAWLACAGADGALGCWRVDPELGATRQLTLSGAGSQITRLAATGAGGDARIIAARRDGTVSIYAVSDSHDPIESRRKCAGGAWAAAAHPRGSHVAAAGADGRIRVWSLADEPFDINADGPVATAFAWARRAGFAFSDDDLQRLDIGENLRRPWLAAAQIMDV